MKQGCIWRLGDGGDVRGCRNYKQVFLGRGEAGLQVCMGNQRKELSAQGLHPMRDGEPQKEFKE